jgi:Ser/Thr protein kinase RdoA (MazF antagonist)
MGEGMPTRWSEELAAVLGRQALSSLGLQDARLTLLKFGTLANFRVENPERFLKVADPGFRSAETVLERSLRVSAWLDEMGFPVAGAAEEGSARPVAVGDAWAGLWSWQDHRDARPDPGTTGELLRRLHELLSACPVRLPELDHLDAARRHASALREKGHLEAAAVDFLLTQVVRMEDDWAAFGSELGVGAIHGDFGVDNVLVAPRGPVLVDLDNAQVGPREWDLVKVTPGSPDGWRDDEWPEFARGYGFDLLSAPGAEVLREVRHLRSLVWMLSDPTYQERLGQGRRLLDEWMREPEKRCFELDWPAESVPG